MLTQKEFKKSGKLYLRRRSNPLIKDLDKLLGVYHSSSATKNKKLKVLVMIYLLCLSYAKTKPDGKRGDSVRELKESAATELNSPQFRTSLSSRAAGGGRRNDLPAVADSATLAPRYQLESVMPQSKTQNKMGLKNKMPVFGMTTVMEKYNNDMAGDDALMNAYAEKSSAAHKFGAGAITFDDWVGAQFDQLSMTARLDKLFGLWGDAMFVGKDMQYLSAESRVEYVVQMSMQGITAMEDGQATTAISCKNRTMKNAGCIYAMDLSERLFVLRGANMNEGQWNHSSALSGQPVICAGELASSNGRIVYINNSSGHYKPDSESLKNCLRVMGNCGINLSQAIIFDKKKGQYFSGAQNYNTGTAMADDPDLTPVFGSIA